MTTVLHRSRLCISVLLCIAANLLLCGCESVHPLVAAAGDGDSRKVGKLIPKAGLEARQDALAAAAVNGHTEIVDMLVDKGVVPRPDSVVMATRSGSLACISVCLNHGDDPNSAEPIRRFVVTQRSDGIEVRCERYNAGWTPLGIAIDRGMMEACRLLIKSGANPNQPFVYQEQKLLSRVYSGDAVTGLIGGSGPLSGPLVIRGATGEGWVQVEPEKYSTPLIWAIRGRRVEMVRLLLSHGANPDVPDSEGKTPTAHASDTGQPRIVDILRSSLAEDTGALQMVFGSQSGEERLKEVREPGSDGGEETSEKRPSQ